MAHSSKWAQYFDVHQDVVLANGDSFRVYQAGTQGPRYMLLHGGGYTSMTWSLTANLMKKSCVVYAMDFRAHGSTTTTKDEDLSIETLVNDCVQVLTKLLGDSDEKNVFIVGHSLGGAVAVRVADAMKECNWLAGLVVIDVVEGTALASLEHMHVVLAKRPNKFASLEDAVEWSLRTGMVRNPEAAQVSIPSQLIQLPGGQFAWRTDLTSTAAYWKNWFIGLSEQFLALSVPKLLILAGSDRLDTPLTRGQMQGKFQLMLLYGSGHIIQEDCPDKVANALLEFGSRIIGFRNPLGGSSGSSSSSSGDANDVLAQRLARARAMIPK